MSHIVESCPLTKLNGGLSRLHSVADQLWLMTRIREEEERRSEIPAGLQGSMGTRNNLRFSTVKRYIENNTRQERRPWSRREL